MAKRKRDWRETVEVGKGLIDEVFGVGVEVLRRVAPQCAYCGEVSVLACTNCGRTICHSHAFVNAQRPNDFRSYRGVCSACMAKHFSFVRVEPGQPPNTDEWPYEQQPWDVLGVSWYASEAEIVSAYKERAMACHPDRGGDESEMKRLTAARDYMFNRRKGGR